MPVKKQTVIPAGALLTVTTGEYSDYVVDGVFRAARDIDAEALYSAWVSTRKPLRPGLLTAFDAAAFLAHATREGFLEPVASLEWHLPQWTDAGDAFMVFLQREVA